MNLYPVPMGLAGFFSTLSGGLFAAGLGRSRLGALTAFATGVLIAVPLFDLLLEGLKLAAQGGARSERILQLTAPIFVKHAARRYPLAEAGWHRQVDRGRHHVPQFMHGEGRVVRDHHLGDSLLVAA